MKRFAKLALLLLLPGCLDSLVDNPCEDGYTLVDEECVIVAADDPFVPDPEVDLAPPPFETTPPAPPKPPATTTPTPTSPEPLQPEEQTTEPTDGLSPCPTCE